MQETFLLQTRRRRGGARDGAGWGGAKQTLLTACTRATSSPEASCAQWSSMLRASAPMSPTISASTASRRESSPSRKFSIGLQEPPDAATRPSARPARARRIRERERQRDRKSGGEGKCV